MKTLIKIISTGFGLGYSPIAPGTAGSLLGVVLFLLLGHLSIYYALCTLIVVAIGFLVSGRAEEIFNQKDCSKIVIDEVAGMCITFVALPPNLWIVLLGFVLFRFFDIFKFGPAKKMESIKGGAGVMLDDIVSGIYASIVLQIVFRLVTIIGL